MGVGIWHLVFGIWYVEEHKGLEEARLRTETFQYLPLTKPWIDKQSDGVFRVQYQYKLQAFRYSTVGTLEATQVRY